MLKVRHISVAREKPLVAIGAFERNVEVWDYKSGKRVSAFDTILDFGGKRLALSISGDRVLAAAWERHGLACYDVQSGQCVWQRHDLKKVQTITCSRDGTIAYCGFDARPCMGIAISNGDKLCSFRGTREVVESCYSEFAVLDRAIPEVVGPDGKRRFRIERTTFAVLSWAIGPETLLLSEAKGGPVRCFKLATGEELWRYTAPRGTLFLDLAYSSKLARFLGISWPYEHGGSKELTWFSPVSGQPEERLDLGRPATTAFSPDGSILISSTGTIYDTARGTIFQTIPVEDGDSAR